MYKSKLEKDLFKKYQAAVRLPYPVPQAVVNQFLADVKRVEQDNYNRKNKK